MSLVGRYGDRPARQRRLAFRGARLVCSCAYLIARRASRLRRALAHAAAAAARKAKNSRRARRTAAAGASHGAKVGGNKAAKRCGRASDRRSQFSSARGRGAHAARSEAGGDRRAQVEVCTLLCFSGFSRPLRLSAYTSVECPRCSHAFRAGDSRLLPGKFRYVFECSSGTGPDYFANVCNRFTICALRV